MGEPFFFSPTLEVLQEISKIIHCKSNFSETEQLLLGKVQHQWHAASWKRQVCFHSVNKVSFTTLPNATISKNLRPNEKQQIRLAWNSSSLTSLSVTHRDAARPQRLPCRVLLEGVRVSPLPAGVTLSCMAVSRSTLHLHPASTCGVPEAAPS